MKERMRLMYVLQRIWRSLSISALIKNEVVIDMFVPLVK